ncbi:pimelyl-ACP methyl ester esterase BioV [Arcobacter sp. s6]|uniref:pimelyl-ACP methyl ester esterase BioV n=1 Tax=Arcobacter sp. s6 TaxID=3230363 RepID=UPI00349FD38F
MKISKKYFSGFCFFEESELFKDYIIQNDFTVSGFSYGAIKAFEEVLNSSIRVDKLQLFSPAFFQTQNEKFKRTQVMYFKKDANAYCQTFLSNVLYPLNIDISKYFKQGAIEELQELLYYEWSQKKLQKLVDKGVKIEVYLGGNDKIIDASKAQEFFKKFATVYYIKEKGHLL